MGKPSKLADPDSFHVRDALTRKCPLCLAPVDKLCVISCGPNTGKPLPGIRKVHYARTRFTEPQC